MSIGEDFETLRHGHSIQGGRIIANNGQTWHEFETYAEALAAVTALQRGIELGKKIGAREALARVREVLGIETI